MTRNETKGNSADGDDGPESSDAPRRSPLILGIFLAIALAIGADVVLDLLEGASVSHVLVEVAVVSAALLGAAILFRDLARERARAHHLTRQLAVTHRDAQRYRDEATELLRGLGQTIDRQLDRWELSAAEKEVAMLLLKGLSHKEVADVRGTSERTARTQARAVYKKAGLEGRAELSAFFLEDLLPPG